MHRSHADSRLEQFAGIHDAVRAGRGGTGAIEIFLNDDGPIL